MSNHRKVYLLILLIGEKLKNFKVYIKLYLKKKANLTLYFIHLRGHHAVRLIIEIMEHNQAYAMMVQNVNTYMLKSGKVNQYRMMYFSKLEMIIR